MHIEKLVLDDFKSFGRETEIPFYEDFTVVTGPNGSGKSNIIDGVLFALGLARTRGIRAEKLTDLIYNPGHADGTRADGPREASVEVILNNEDGTLDRSQVVNAAGTDKVGDVDRVTVKRRVKETDDNYYSYYYLNGRSVNLSDVRDLLAQAGVTPEGYNVVMQGDVTGIINMTPHERREVIDEIAGVAEFDAKKEDAFEELETVEDRIEEAQLRIDEKTERLERLSDERDQALAYQDLRDEKEEYEGYLTAAELEERRDELGDVESEIESARSELAERRERLDEATATVQERQSELDDLNAEIERTGEEEQLEIKSEIEEIKGEIATLEGKIETQSERRDDAETDRREAFVQIDRKNEEIDELDDEIRDAKIRKADLKSTLAAKQSDLAEVESEIENADTAYDELKAELEDEKRRLEELREERHERQRERDRLLDDARRRSSEIEEVESEIADAETELPELRRRLSELESELDSARKNRETAAGLVEDLREEKADLESELDGLESEIRERQNEYAELEARAEQTGDSSWPRAVTTVTNAEFGGVHGPVGELGAVDSEYATACETAAGGRLANVVVDDDGVGSDCIDYLKQRNAGQATFLPLTEMDERRLPSLPSHPGVVDFARSLVDYDATYEGVFSYVLGKTLVVEDMETARDLMGQYRMVTLDGDLVETSGAMTGGSGGGSRYAFSKSGEGKLERIAEEIHDLEDDRQALREEIQAVEGDIEDARERVSAAKETVREVTADRDRAETEIEETDARIEELRERKAELESERESVDAEMTELDEELAELSTEIDEREARVEEIEAELADSEIPQLSDRADEIRAEIDDVESRMSEVDAELNELELEREYAEDAVEDLNDTVEAAQERKADAEAKIEEFEDRVAELESELTAKRDEIAELEEELAGLKEERSTLRERLQTAESERDEAESAVEETSSRLDDLEATADELRREIDRLSSSVGDYDPEEIPDHDTVESEIERLSQEMSAMEPVNMLAIEEYDEVEAELAELEERRDVLAEERDGIEDRIASYEDQKRETFRAAFDSIDGHFREIFQRLSSGSGELHLENPEEPFDGGLTMKAQPADKPVQRLDAMSGGEKSLTALAFIFAIQRHNPAPFYALDEVDAFLDAANAERVGELVDELAEEAQFVVVSHRSALLDRSERAVGVTMQEDNVSAVTGIQLDGESDRTEVSADD
ncbi:chromosome segregation protein SMC [Halobaculum sp. MBLA0143]|uniref:chromosome segregation protein SMC n=1 Tax=Halobaculum sp. MBLA0143 TaxID=3079933 RepID=UPI0035249278